MNFNADFRPCLAIGNTPHQHAETSGMLGGKNHAAQYLEEEGEVFFLKEKERRALQAVRAVMQPRVGYLFIKIMTSFVSMILAFVILIMNS